MLLDNLKQNYWEWRADIRNADLKALLSSTFSRARFSSIADSVLKRTLADRVLNQLLLLKGIVRGLPVDRLQHSLQTATHAFRAEEDEEYVVCALLHDIGDTLGTINHAEIAAAILKPFVSSANLWMIEKHTIFQQYYLHHFEVKLDHYRGHPFFQRTADFCEKYDSVAFDPNMRPMPLQAFEPMVRRLFARPPKSAE